MPAPLVVRSLDDVQYLFDQLFDQGLGVLAGGVQMAALTEFKSLTVQRSVLASAVGGGHQYSGSTDIAACSMAIDVLRPLLVLWQGDSYFHNATSATQTPTCRPYVDGAGVSYETQALEYSDNWTRQSVNGTDRKIRNMAWVVVPSELGAKNRVATVSIRDPSPSTDGTGSSYWAGGNGVLSCFQA